VAYTGGNELYAWPDSGAFERSIEELLPAHGMVSNGSYALHVRTLFLRSVAQFSEPRKSGGRIELDFSVPAVRSGYAMSTSAGSVPAGLEGSVRLDPASLDLERLEVRVMTRLANSLEITTYARARIGDVEFVAPLTSELTLIDRDRIQLRNSSRFDEYHRYAGSATIRYEPGGDPPVDQSPPAARDPLPPGNQITAALERAIEPDAAIGDQFTAIAEGGAHVKGRITDMRRAGTAWTIELTLGKGVIRRTVRLPLPAGWKAKWPQER
jgi:hypothetical protein